MLPLKTQEPFLKEADQLELIDLILRLQKEAFPAMGPSYKFLCEKASKKLMMLSESNKNLLTNPELRTCYSCKFLHDQTCIKKKKTNLAALVQWSGCGLYLKSEIPCKEK